MKNLHTLPAVASSEDRSDGETPTAQSRKDNSNLRKTITKSPRLAGKGKSAGNGGNQHVELGHTQPLALLDDPASGSGGCAGAKARHALYVDVVMGQHGH